MTNLYTFSKIQSYQNQIFFSLCKRRKNAFFALRLMKRQFGVNFEPKCFWKNIINTLVLCLKTTVRSEQMCFLIPYKNSFDSAHYLSELDTNNTEEL